MKQKHSWDFNCGSTYSTENPTYRKPSRCLLALCWLRIIKFSWKSALTLMYFCIVLHFKVGNFCRSIRCNIRNKFMEMATPSQVLIENNDTLPQHHDCILGSHLSRYGGLDFRERVDYVLLRYIKLPEQFRSHRCSLCDKIYENI